MTSHPPLSEGRTGRPPRRSGPNAGKRFSKATTSNPSSGTSDAPPLPVGHNGQKSVGRKVLSLRSVAKATHWLRNGSNRSSGIGGPPTVGDQVPAVRKLVLDFGQPVCALAVEQRPVWLAARDAVSRWPLLPGHACPLPPPAPLRRPPGSPRAPPVWPGSR